MFTTRKYLSGTAKRKRRKEKEKSLSKRKRTLEDLGWGTKKLKIDLGSEIEVATDDQASSIDNISSQNTVYTAYSCSINDSIDGDTADATSVSFCSSDPATWKQLSSLQKN